MTMRIRHAEEKDQATLVEFNRRMAWETEQKKLDSHVLSQGVAAVLADPSKGLYLVAERDADVVGQLMITKEWSDWRNAYFWWIQSAYVRDDARRAGVFRALYREVERLAQEAHDVIGLRLYVERENLGAQAAYANLGMDEADYLMFFADQSVPD